MWILCEMCEESVWCMQWEIECQWAFMEIWESMVHVRLWDMWQTLQVTDELTLCHGNRDLFLWYHCAKTILYAYLWASVVLCWVCILHLIGGVKSGSQREKGTMFHYWICCKHGLASLKIYKFARCIIDASLQAHFQCCAGILHFNGGVKCSFIMDR